MDPAPTTYKWRPIEDLPSNWRSLESHELHALAQVWEDQRRDLEAMHGLQEFNHRLLRQWAVETGIIERLYTLDRGITQLLVERGLEASLIPHGATNKDPNLVISIIRDQLEAVEGLFDFVKRRRSLSASYMKELHALLTRNQRTMTAMNTEASLPPPCASFEEWRPVRGRTSLISRSFPMSISRSITGIRRKKPLDVSNDGSIRGLSGRLKSGVGDYENKVADLG